MQLQQKITILSIQTNKYIQENNEMKLKYQNKEKEMQRLISKNEENINQLKIKVNYLTDISRKKSPKTILIGLNNIGATCYMNATLQCLSNTKDLTDYFLNLYKKNQNNIMANEYYKVIINLWNENKNNSSYSPYSFKETLSRENPLFEGIAANDSKDLINFLLERFHLELNNIKINNINNNNIYSIMQQDQVNEQKMLNLFLNDFKEKFNSPISNLFYGTMETKSQCHGCNIIKFNFQVYSFLEFPLQQVNQYFFNNNKRPLYHKDGSNPDVDLYECFEYYGKVDLMSGDNQMHCNICNRLCNAYYSTIIYSTPIYLIINLNRGKGAIYQCKVNFPE